MRCLKFEA